MTTSTFTYAGVNHLWSTAANWDNVPADNYLIVIPTTQVCEYDGNMSDAGTWPNGVDGITITGTLKLTRTAGTYYLKIKAAKTITGAGTFDCGASAVDAIPFAAKHTTTGGAGWYINGALGLTMTVYAAEPVIKTILQTALEPILETVIAVDTSVVGDLWADGDTIRIDDINKAQESEARVIAAGGIAGGAITITVGLTLAKSPGAYVSLMSRNVKFIGVSSTGIVQGFSLAGKLIVAGGEWTNTSTLYIFHSCANIVISGGSFSGCDRAINAGSYNTISGGVFSGIVYVLYLTNTGVISGGTFTGCSYVLQSCYGFTISSGIFSGCNYILSNSSGVTITSGTFLNSNYVMNLCAGINIFGGTFTGNYYGMASSRCTINNAAYSLNTWDVYISTVTCFNTSFSVGAENLSYNLLSRETYSESLDHNKLPGTFRAWTRGGITSSVVTPLPTGFAVAYNTILAIATIEGFWQKEVLVAAGASTSILMWLRKDASMTYLPRCIIFNKALTDPFAGGAGINTFTMTNSIDTYESQTYVYTNTGTNDVTLVIRFQGMNATGNMYSALSITSLNVDLTRLVNGLVPFAATVNDAGATTTTFITTLTSSVTDFYKGEAVVFSTGALQGQLGQIKSYNGSTKAITLQSGLTSAPANGDGFVVATVAASRKFADFLSLLDSSGRSNVGLVTDVAQTGRDLGATLGVAGAGLTALGDTRLAHLQADITSVPAGVGDAMTLSTTALDAILDRPAAGTKTLRQLVIAAMAEFLGKATGGGTAAILYYDAEDDAKLRVSLGTTDADGNRATKAITDYS